MEQDGIDVTNMDLTNMKERLAVLAESLKNNLGELKRPFIIEFAGTPKAGKTSSISAIAKFFRRHDIPVYIVSERASICPIGDKHHLFFNVWTGTSSLLQLLESLEKKASVLILDRGIFDSLVWIDFLSKWKSVTSTESKVIQDFLLFERWSNLVDIVVALTVEPSRSLEREYKDQITDAEGSIMNTENLVMYNESLRKCIEKYKSNFRKIVFVDTTKQTEPAKGVGAIAFEVIKTANQLADEQIAVVDRDIVVSNLPIESIFDKRNEIGNFLSKVIGNLKWVRRTEAENDLSLIQIIPVSIITKGNEILLFDIRGKQGRMANKHSIWAGGHIRKSDRKKDQFYDMLPKATLVRELDEEIKLRVEENDFSKYPISICWDTSTPKSAQHLGLIYEYKIPNKTPKQILDKREFWESPEKSLFTFYQPISQDLAVIEDMESWSISILQTEYHINFEPKLAQNTLL